MCALERPRRTIRTGAGTQSPSPKSRRPGYPRRLDTEGSQERTSLGGIALSELHLERVEEEVWSLASGCLTTAHAAERYFCCRLARPHVAQLPLDTD